MLEAWARENNLTLNRTKTKEIVFVDTCRRRQVAAPPALPGIDSVTSLKILGVTMTNGLSVSDHIRHIISDCVQTLYALRVLRAHGMCDTALQAIYKSVVVTKLLYALAHGLDLLWQPIGSESTHFSAAASAVNSVPLTFHCSRICSKHPTNSSLAK